MKINNIFGEERMNSIGHVIDIINNKGILIPINCIFVNILTSSPFIQKLHKSPRRERFHKFGRKLDLKYSIW